MAAKPKPDDKDQSKRFIDTAREIGADEASSAADAVLGRLAKQAPEPRLQAVTTGRKLDPPPDYEALIDGIPAGCYVVQWIVEGKPVPVVYQKHYLATERAGKLFDEYGPDLEIEIHLNRVSPPSSLLYSGARLRKWNKEGRPRIQGD